MKHREDFDVSRGHDISEEQERTQIEAALRESGEIFRAIFENAHDGIILADAEAKKFRFGNDMICRMLGYDKEELKDVGVLDIHPEEDLPDVMEKFKMIARNELALTKGMRVRRKDRSIFYADIGASPLKLNGKDYVIGIFRDVTEQKKAEKEREGLLKNLQDALEKVSISQKEWQGTFDNIGDLISIHDRDFNIIKINKALSEYLNLPYGQILNKKCYNLFHNCNIPVPNCPHRHTLAERRSVTEEVHDPKTARTFRVSTFPYYSPKGELLGSIHIARDITVEREKEVQLIMSDRLAALGQMASGIAHEINNPLASIAGCAEGLLSRIKKGKFDPELFENYLNIIDEEISRCKNITDSILSFVRKTSYVKKNVDMKILLDRTLELIGFQGRLEQVNVIRKYDPELPAFYVSEGELRQVILAIITNALDAMKDKGTLTVETGTEGDTVFIKISDTGPGILTEHIDGIFKPFFTTKSETGGTGLGLAIANKIITNHGGSIDVFSETGKGTAFRIVLQL